MSLQFNCPFCQLLMTSDPRFAGGQVQCPSCHQVFMIGGAVPVVPVAQVRSVAPPQPQVPARPAAPPVQRPGQLRRSSSGKSEPKTEGKGLVVAAIIGLVLAGVGLIYGGIWFVGKMETMAAKKNDFELPPEVKARDAAMAAQRRKDAEDERNEADKERSEFTAFLAKDLCDGDAKIAGELAKEIYAINDELNALYADADSDNDPKDLRAFWTKSLTAHAANNNVLYHWLGGKSGAAIAAALFGEDESARRSRGHVADFLVGGNYDSTGTGFFIAADGWLLTNQHVVQEATEVDIRGEDGIIRKAKVIKADAEGDVALLKAEAPPKAWLHLTASEVPMGSDVCTVGFPKVSVQGVEPKYTVGAISSLTGIRDETDNYQTTVPLQPGNSGGPLVEMKDGSVVGIVASHLKHSEGAENVSYAIKSSVAQKLIASVPEAAAAANQPASAGHSADNVALAANVKAAIVMVLVK